MAGVSTTRVPLENWCDDPYRSAPEAIREIDALVEGEPEDALAILHTAWTGVVILSQRRNGMIPDPRWYSTLGKFCKLTSAERDRVRDAVEMRLRAIERCAA